MNEPCRSAPRTAASSTKRRQLGIYQIPSQEPMVLVPASLSCHAWFNGHLEPFPPWKRPKPSMIIPVWPLKHSSPALFFLSSHTKTPIFSKTGNWGMRLSGTSPLHSGLSVTCGADTNPWPKENWEFAQRSIAMIETTSWNQLLEAPKYYMQIHCIKDTYNQLIITTSLTVSTTTTLLPKNGKHRQWWPQTTKCTTLPCTMIPE